MVKLSHKSSPCSVSVPKVVPNPNLNISVYVMFAIFAVAEAPGVRKKHPGVLGRVENFGDDVEFI